MSKQMKKYCIIGKIICNLTKTLGVIVFFMMWIVIFVFSLIG